MSDAVDHAHDVLRRQIFGGDLPAGSRLKERDLCDVLEVSRTPVREALRRLQADGLVTIEPRRGAVVNGISSAEAEEIYSLGRLLEGYGARIAATRRSAADLSKLKTILEQMEHLLAKPARGTAASYLELDNAFHRRISRCTGNLHLERIISQVVGLPILIRAFSHYSHNDLILSLQQHQTIYSALRAGDPEWSEAAMRAHVLTGRSLALGLPEAQRLAETGEHQQR